MKKSTAYLTLLTLAVLLGLGTDALAQPTTYYWVGKDFTSGAVYGDYWSYGNSWSTSSGGGGLGSALPSAQNYLNFDNNLAVPANGLYNVTNDNYAAGYQIFFKSGAPAFNLYGAGMGFYDYSSADPQIENQGVNVQNVWFPVTNGNLHVSGAVRILQINNSGLGSGPLVFNGPVSAPADGNARVINIGGSGTVTFSNAISDGGSGTMGVTLLTANRTVFAANNTYAGNTTINAGQLVVTNGGAIRSPAGTLNIGAVAATPGTNILTGGGAITVQTLLATNIVLGGATNSIFNFSGGTLTTSNNLGLAANILIASNSLFSINGNWNMNAGTNIVAAINPNGLMGTNIIGNGVNNCTVTVNSNAVWQLGAGGGATNLNLAIGYGNATNNLLLVNGGIVSATNMLNEVRISGAANVQGSQVVLTNGGIFNVKLTGSAGSSCFTIGTYGQSNSCIIMGTNGAGVKSQLIGYGDRIYIGNNSSSAPSNNWMVVGAGGLVTNNGSFQMWGNNDNLFVTNGGMAYFAGINFGRFAALGSTIAVGGTDASGNPATLNVLGNNFVIGGGLNSGSPGSNCLVSVVAGGVVTNCYFTLGASTNSYGNSVVITNGGQFYANASAKSSSIGYSNLWGGFTAAANFNLNNNNALAIGSSLANSSILNMGNNVLYVGTVQNLTNTTSTNMVMSTNSTLTLFAGGTLTNASSLIMNGSGSTIYFNGGTLAAGAAGTLISSNNPYVANASNIVQSGGAVINDGGFTVGQGSVPFTHDPGLGATLDGGLTKLGAGTLVLTNYNTYTGPTIVTNGTLFLGNNLALNGGTNSVIVTNAGKVFFGTPYVTFSKTTNGFLIGGNGGGAGALEVGNNVTAYISGPITNAADATILADGGASFSILGTVYPQGNTLTLSADAGQTSFFVGNWSGLGGISANTGGHTGQWNIQATSIALSGPLTINSGTLALASGGTAIFDYITNVVSGSGTLVLGGNGGGSTSFGTFFNTGNNFLGNLNISSSFVANFFSIGDGGSTFLSGNANTLGLTTPVGGLTFNTRNFLLSGNTSGNATNYINANGSGGVIIGSSISATNGTGEYLQLGGNYTGLNQITGSVSNGFAATNVVSILVNSSGIWRFAGANNNYSGGTFAKGGTLQADANNTLGTGLLTLNGGVLSNNVSATLTNDVNLAVNSTVGVGGGQNLTLGGLVTNTFALTKAGAGTLTLTNANTFSGALNVKAGTVNATTSKQAFGVGTVNLGDSAGNASASLGLIGFSSSSAFTNPLVVVAGNTGTMIVSNSGGNVAKWTNGAITVNKAITFMGCDGGGLQIASSISGSAQITVSNDTPANFNNNSLLSRLKTE